MREKAGVQHIESDANNTVFLEGCFYGNSKIALPPYPIIKYNLWGGTMYTIIQEAHAVFTAISNTSVFTLRDDVSGKVKTGNKWTLLDWQEALDLLTDGNTSVGPVDADNVEAWAICEESASRYCNIYFL